MPSLDQFLHATLQLMPQPVAQGFTDALRQAEPWRQAGQVFGEIAEGAGLTLEAAMLRWVAAAAGPVANGLGVAYGAARNVASADDRAKARNATNRPFTQTNAGIANAFMQLQMSDLRRNFEMGERVEATAAGLAGAVDRMRDSWSEWDAMTQNASNRGAAFAAGASSSWGDSVAPFAAAMNSAMERLDPDGSRSAAAGRWVGGIPGQILEGAFPVAGVLLDKLLEAGFGNQDPAARFVQGWQQEMLNIMAGGQVNRVGLVAGPRLQQVVRARAGAGGRANAALRAPVGAVEWNQRQGLPVIILP